MKIIPVFVLAAIVAVSFSSGAQAAVPNKDLSFGSRGEDVVSLQHELIAYGGPAAQALSKVGATGYFGPLTRAALVEFQKSNGITPAAGYFGAKTRAALSLRSEPEVLYTGTISAVDTGCFVDAVCSVTVGGKKVVLLTGERLIGPRETGALKGVDSIGDLEGKIGAEARVYAAKLNKEWGDYTLEGKSNYYVHVLGELPKSGPVTLTGEHVCLPAKEMYKPTIMLCAFGLLADDGRYYALRAKEGVDLWQHENGKIQVTGTFTKGAVQHPVFQGEGTIEIESVKVLK